jgi:group II intron reverse transcriptase/maturase
LRSAGNHQLNFAFADSPKGGKDAAPPGQPDGKAHLLLRAKGMRAEDPAAGEVVAEELLERIAAPANLATALMNVARNKGAPGVDGCSIREVVGASYLLLPKLRRALLDGSYRPGDIRRVWIPKPGGGQRGLGIPNVVDRWVQQAAHQQLEPIFEPTFHPSSHGFRPRRGAHTAIPEARRYVKEGHGYVVDIDLSKFFDRVHHQRLLSRLGQKITDRRVLLLIKRMLKANVVMPDGMRVTTEEGTPQGGPLSPLLSNIVLDELDQELHRRGLRFVRYADDCNIFVRSERAGLRVMASTRRFIEKRLRLVVNEEKSAVARPSERHFLGFRLCVAEDGTIEVHLSRKAKSRMDTRIRELTPRKYGQSLPSLFARANEYLQGWFHYFKIVSGDGAMLMPRFDAHIRRRIRAIIVTQKKRPRFLYRHLIERGVHPRNAAKVAWCGRGTWPRSNLPGVTRAYRNEWFHERLFCLRRHWLHLYGPPRSVSGQQLLLDL